jgi:hypothetical protein
MHSAGSVESAPSRAVPCHRSSHEGRRAIPAVAAGWMMAIACAVLGGAAEAQEIRIREGAHVVVAGSSITLPIELETTDSVTGFSFGVRHDGAVLTLERVIVAAPLAGALGIEAGADPNADFVLVDLAPEGGTGFVVAAILADSAAGGALGAGTHHLFDAVYDSSATGSGSTTVSTSGELGSRPVELIIDVGSGASRSFAAKSVEVSFATGYRRGDVDGNGNIALTDAVRILRFLFQGGEIGTCAPTLNVDGSTNNGGADVEDRQDIQLTDAIQLLRFIFLNGQAPAAPFPACGQSAAPLGETLRCEEYLGC